MCFVLLLLESLPFFSRKNCTLVVLIYNSVFGIVSLTIQEIFHPQNVQYQVVSRNQLCLCQALSILIFCLMEVLIIAPIPSDIVPPLWIRMSGCTAYDTSTHHLTILVPSELSISGISVVVLRYCISLSSFFQLSLLRPRTRVVKKATAVCISGRDLFVA